jgi:EpsI family protein
MASFLKSRSARILTVVLFAQASLFYGFSRRENVPAHQQLENFSFPADKWTMVEDSKLDAETLEVLKADDILSRLYVDKQTGQAATLFVAYFETQRTGKVPHSPKNCLPGSGWTPSQSGVTEISVPGQAQPIRVNQYVVSRGQNQSIVFYWYQTRNRVIASEYSAKIYTVADAIRYNRSDTALVRVVVNVSDGNINEAMQTGISFVQSFFQPLKNYLPA